MAEAAAHSAKRNWAVADPWLLLSTVALCGIGLVMVYSASSVLAAKRYGDSAVFFQQQLAHMAVGLGAMIALAAFDYAWLRRVVYLAMAAVLALLILVLIPGIGHTAGGATRWLRLGGMGIQPAELAKLALMIYLAYSLSEHKDQVKSLTKGFLPNLGAALLLMLPILAEPDMGMCVMLFTLAVVMLFVAGARVSHLAALGLLAAPALYALVVFFPYRFKRLTVFWDPWADPLAGGFQIIHSFLAFGSGGLTGVGLGGSKQKLFYLPEPHTDFIFSVLGEEMGLLGVTLVIALFLVLVWRGLKASLEARDLFGTYLALGATLIIGLQAFTNAGVVMGLLPTKGLTLPFISSGGSSLLTNLACVGVLLSVAKHKGRAQ